MSYFSVTFIIYLLQNDQTLAETTLPKREIILITDKALNISKVNTLQISKYTVE